MPSTPVRQTPALIKDEPGSEVRGRQVVFVTKKKGDDRIRAVAAPETAKCYPNEGLGFRLTQLTSWRSSEASVASVGAAAIVLRRAGSVQCASQ